MIKVATACFAASSYRSLNLQPVTILLELKAVWKMAFQCYSMLFLSRPIIIN